MANQTNVSNTISLPFNPKHPTVMHIDLNSCFATIEQQANPKLRGKPIAVAAYTTDSAIILAPSIEAKRYDIKVGMRVREGKMLYPKLVVLPPDPNKYRNIHLELKRIMADYTDHFAPKSIDEFVLDLEGMPAYKKGMVTVAKEIKQRIKDEVGEWLTVSIGIAPNRYLAKIGAGLHKPDGLDVIDEKTYLSLYPKILLTDLTGIKTRNAIRLHTQGIYTTLDFFYATRQQLKGAFQSILAYVWYLRLRGWEADDVLFDRRSYGNSYALPRPLTTAEELAPILQKLVEKTGRRLRKAGYKARGVHLALFYRDRDFWHKGMTFSEYIFDSRDIYKVMFRILQRAPHRKPVSKIMESVFDLKKEEFPQLTLFEDLEKKEKLVSAMDELNDRYGNFVITPARMLGTENAVVDRIAFGGIKELEEILVS